MKPEIYLFANHVHVRADSCEQALAAIDKALGPEAELTFEERVLLLKAKWEGQSWTAPDVGVARKVADTLGAEPSGDERTADLARQIEDAMIAQGVPEFPFATPETPLEALVRKSLEGPE
jgi:hypothetical protein